MSCVPTVFVGLLLSLLPSLAAGAGDVVYASVLPDALGPPISPSFLGFSLEWDVASTWTGRNHTRPSFINLMKQLQQSTLLPHPHPPTTIRLGGNSADYSWYNPDDLPFPKMPGVTFSYNITDVDIRALAAGARATNISLIVGLNFRRPSNASWAVRHMQAVQRIVGFDDGIIQGVELGNEVDDYADNGNRLRNYTLQEYYQDFAFYRDELKAQVPHWPTHFFQGAAYGGYPVWEVDLPRYARMFDEDVAGISVHFYPEYACSPPLPTLADLLRDRDAREMQSSLVNSSAGNLVEILRALGHPLLLGEGNSVACSGTGNVSNVFGANLWLLDQLYQSSAIGLANYHFHAHDRNLSHYPPLIWQHGDEDDTPTVQAEWYGIMWFAMSTCNAAQLRTVNLSSTTNERIKVWASLVEASGQLSVTVLHKDLAADPAVPAVVHVDVGRLLQPPLAAASLYEFSAPSPYSTYGLSWMGLTWDGTKDGFPSGRPVRSSVSAQGTVYSISVRPMTAVLLTIDKQPMTADTSHGQSGSAWKPRLHFHQGSIDGPLRSLDGNWAGERRAVAVASRDHAPAAGTHAASEY